MGNFFKSLFGSSTTVQEENTEEKNKKRNFDILKYDGIKALKIRKPGYAVRCFREALALQEDAETWEYLAEAYIQIDQPDNAIDAYTRLYALDPSRPDTLLRRALLHFTNDRPGETAADCSRILSTGAGQSDSRAYLLRARALRQLGQAEPALEDLDRALALTPEAPEAHLQRAALLSEMDRPAEALNDADTALTLAPEEENAYMQRARIHETLGNLQAAATDYRQVIGLNPFHEEAYLQLGRLLATIQQLDEALRLFDEALEIKPDFVRAYTARAQLHEIRGNAEAARNDYEQARELGGTEETATAPVNFEDMYANRPL